MPRVKKSKSIKSFLIHRLRRLSLWWPEMAKARDRAKVYIQIGWHKNGNPMIKRYFVCQDPECGLLCENENEGVMDHIIPVVDVESGFIDWNAYIPGLFCDSSNLQFLCHASHNLKTEQENILRKNT